MVKKKKLGFIRGLEKLSDILAPELVDKDEIEKIVKSAKSVKLRVEKLVTPGLFKDKHDAYIIYEVGAVKVTEDLVSYKGETFEDSMLASWVKKRALELDPKAVAKCEQEKEAWKQSAKTKRVSRSRS